jgi:hypothetical protein
MTAVERILSSLSGAHPQRMRRAPFARAEPCHRLPRPPRTPHEVLQLVFSRMIDLHSEL